jgi:prephenate dehydratase
MSPQPERAPGRLRVGYLGPAGTFSEEALLASAEQDAVEPVGQASFQEAARELGKGRVELAILPIENSLEGSINVTLDLLAERAPELQIVGEALLRVRHCLIGAREVPLADIRTVVSHPQVPGQCSAFLREELAQASVLPAGSTAEAVRTVVTGGDPATAAIGTALAGEIYGGTVLREGVEDRHDNETRFVWLARREDAEHGWPARTGHRVGEWRCSLVFWGAGADRAGWLVDCLREFADREINLTKIESRPRRREMGAYMFFVDLAGRERDAEVAEALAGLARHCEQVLVLGSYRAALAGAAPATLRR